MEEKENLDIPLVNDKGQATDIDNCDADSLEGDNSSKHDCGNDECDIAAECEKIITNLNFKTEEELVGMLGDAANLSQSNSSLSDNLLVSPSTSTQAINNVQASPSTSMQAINNVQASPSTSMEALNNVQASRSLGMQSINNVHVSPFTSFQAIDRDTCKIDDDKTKVLYKSKTVNGETPAKPSLSQQTFHHSKLPKRRNTTDVSSLSMKPRKSLPLREISAKGQERLNFTKKRSPSDTLRLCERKSPLDDCHNVRETVTSRMRYEKGHNTHEVNECEGDDYMTPTQRKEVELRQFKRDVKNLRKELAEKVEEIDLLRKNIDKEAAGIIEDKDDKIRAIQEEMKVLQFEQDELRQLHEESVKNGAVLEHTIAGLKETMAIREKKNADIYLEMYRKGQESAKFERGEELERMAVRCDGSSATIKELLEKLMNTEMALAKWQAFRRQESYDNAEVPDTEAAATMRFLKDSFFHFLTDAKESENHLRAMIRIFNFTDPQKKKIATAIAERKNKKTGNYI